MIVLNFLLFWDYDYIYEIFLYILVLVESILDIKMI